MGTAPAELVLARHDEQGLRDQRDEVLSVYQEVYADRLDEPFFHPDRFWARVESGTLYSGFRLVTGRVDGELVGFTLGAVLPADTLWWWGFTSDVAPELLRETGSRTFAIFELQVRQDWRRRGCAKAMTDALLADLRVERITLTVRAENTPARTAYLSWGFHPIGHLRPFDDAPLYEAMVLDLPTSS